MPTVPVSFLALLLCGACIAQGPENVMMVRNRNSPDSQAIADYYVRKRAIPSSHVCTLSVTAEEKISRAVFEKDVRKPLADCLVSRMLSEQVLYLVTTLGVPLVIDGATGIAGDMASVDSELTLLYAEIKGQTHALAGMLNNPFFRQRDVPFNHKAFPIYLVTRLAAYDVGTVKRMIDQSLAAVNRGRVVLDMRNYGTPDGDDWLKKTASLLPADRVSMEATRQVVYGQRDVIGYASWGSNDNNRTRRLVGFQWLPGALMTEFVSTDGRTFKKPPDSWNISSWKSSDAPKWWFGSPQSLSADYLMEGATGASGHVDEPYLAMTPRPEELFPAYLGGRNLAESYYLAIPGISWMNIVLGDPLCRLPKK